jgi:hypothetical protein
MTTPMRTFLRAPAILALCAAICAPVAAAADVVRPAPNFGIDGVAKGTSLRSFHGQSVVLVITKSARVKEFRRELARLKQMYSQFSNEKVIFVAAIENGPAEVRSDIPFVTAANPAQVAADYGVTDRFAIAVIGVDGNLDMITGKVINAARVRDIIFNNFESQQAARKPTGG